MVLRNLFLCRPLDPDLYHRGLDQGCQLGQGAIEPRKIRARFIDQAPLTPEWLLGMRQMETHDKAGEHHSRSGDPKTALSSVIHFLPPTPNARRHMRHYEALNYLT
jgi:hypothetical protein